MTTECQTHTLDSKYGRTKCRWCRKDFEKQYHNHRYCCEAHRELYRQHKARKKREHMRRIEGVKTHKRVIVEKHNYVSEIEKWRAGR